MRLLVSYGREWNSRWLQAINSLSAEDNCLQVTGSLVQNETIFLEFSLKYDNRAL